MAIKKKFNKPKINLGDSDFHGKFKKCEKKKIELKNLILKEGDQNAEVFNFIENHFDCSFDNTYITSTSTRFNIEKLSEYTFSGIINLKKVNDTRYINKFLEAVNIVLPYSGLYFGKVETFPNRRKAILEKYPPVLNWLIYVVDLMFTRVFPKLFLTKKLYFYLTKGKGRVLSKAETYGRLYSCGFEIVAEKTIENYLYFIVKKVKEPTYDSDPTYGPIIRLKRIGKGGHKFNVYKLRTMHPFSEYLQEYIYKKNSLREGGKIKNDFRISPEGRILRKFWIDEIPMLWNILKGDMKIVGVRPLSMHYFSLYTKDLQNLRTQFKPGFIPPFYADNPKTLKEIMASEKRYLLSYQKKPLSTDLYYLVKALNNVFFKGLRSF